MALLRALLCRDAETLLLDEPFTGMDAELVRQAVQTTVRLVGQRPTILVTHDLAAAQMLGWTIRELQGNTAQFPPDGLSTAPAAAAQHLCCQNAR